MILLKNVNRRILISLSVIGIVAAFAIGGTVAYFSDTETSIGNNFKAGKFNLLVGSECTYNGETQSPCTWVEKDLNNELFFNFNDVKPGDDGENTVNLHIDNNDAWVCAMLSNLKSNDNGCEKPESDIDTSCGESEGELNDNLFFTVWKDTDCDNILDLEIPGSPEVLAHCGSGSNPMFAQLCASDGTNQSSCESDDDYGCVWIPYQPAVIGVPSEQVLVNNQKIGVGVWPIADSTNGGVPIEGGADYCLGISWNVPLATGNIIQTDSVTGDMQFVAVQARNMDTFTCAETFAEVCDGIDNNFNGVIDDGDVCWTSPTSNNDASWWRNDSNGRDGDINSTTVTNWMSLGQWTDTLTYYLSPVVPSGKLRFYSTGNWGSNIEIKATVDGVSQLVYSGDNSYAWKEMPLSPAGLVSQVDIRGTNAKDPDFSVGTHLGEIQILRTP
ncbi:MAG: SipW-dependent-type signal peptide-containing protein [Candidatus Parcubacteria bacterium]|nr:SipW-dependent-type signal peptide-containing protein [Candidatus Parcubacteria bacterium]